MFVSSNEDMRQLSGILYGIILSSLDLNVSDKRIKDLIASIMDKNRNKSLELYASLYALSSLQEYKFYNADKNCAPLIEQNLFDSIGKYKFLFYLDYNIIVS